MCYDWMSAGFFFYLINPEKQLTLQIFD